MPISIDNSMINMILSVSGFFIGVIGIILAVVFYFKAKIVAIPKYTIENIQLIELDTGDFPHDVSMYYHEKQIARLNKTTLSFVNAGRKTIDKNDLSPEYLDIEFEETDKTALQILSIDINEISRKAITVKTEIHDDTHIRIYFNYLDYRDRFSITIIHTGQKIPNSIAGNIKGVPKGIINVSAAAEARKQLFLSSILDVTDGLFSSLVSVLRLLLQR